MTAAPREFVQAIQNGAGEAIFGVPEPFDSSQLTEQQQRRVERELDPAYATAEAAFVAEIAPAIDRLYAATLTAAHDFVLADPDIAHATCGCDLAPA